MPWQPSAQSLFDGTSYANLTAAERQTRNEVFESFGHYQNNKRVLNISLNKEGTENRLCPMLTVSMEAIIGARWSCRGDAAVKNR